MVTTGFRWKTSPVRGIGIPVQRRVELVPVAVFQVGQVGGRRWSSRAKQIRPWTDRTDAARAGLSDHAEMVGDNTVIQCYHQARHGQFLETGTRFMEARQSILPAMNEVAPQIIADAQAIVRAVMGGRA